MTSDRELFGRIQSRDAGALAELYDRYAPRLHALALRLTSDATAAALVLESAFRRIWEDPPAADDNCHGTLARITREAVGHGSLQRTKPARPPAATPRNLVEMAYFEHRSVEDLARTCGLDQPEVRRLLRQGMGELKAQFARAGNE